MIALDTNVLARFIALDDVSQARAVRRLLKSAGETFFISLPVTLELSWLLRSHFEFTSDEIAHVLRALLAKEDFIFEEHALVAASVTALEKGADFNDHLICLKARLHGCTSLATFDQGLIKRHPSFASRPT